MTLDLRPQPLGIFPLPASYLLLPATAQGEQALAALLQGEQPTAWPDAWRFYALALQGDLDGAWQAVAAENSALARYNRFVLRSDPQIYADLFQEIDADLRPLLAVVGYTLGYADPPAPSASLDHELLAFVLMGQATGYLEQESPEAAIACLEQAIVAANLHSPVLAALLLGTLAETHYTYYGASPQVVNLYQRAIQRLTAPLLQGNRAEMLINLGICYQEMAQGQRGALLEAARCYQDALRTVQRENEPELYALAHNNLALTYLALPMTEASDQLRVGIAVQSLREALKVYMRSTHPAMWSSVQLNLASALQYLPSAHPEENLIEAIKLYDELLTVRSPAVDPVGYARLLANQGNALAHLGILDHAATNLRTALDLFEQHHLLDEAAALQAILGQIEQHGTLSTPAI